MWLIRVDDDHFEVGGVLGGALLGLGHRLKLVVHLVLRQVLVVDVVAVRAVGCKREAPDARIER